MDANRWKIRMFAGSRKLCLCLYYIRSHVNNKHKMIDISAVSSWIARRLYTCLVNAAPYVTSRVEAEKHMLICSWSTSYSGKLRLGTRAIHNSHIHTTNLVRFYASALYHFSLPLCPFLAHTRTHTSNTLASTVHKYHHILAPLARSLQESRVRDQPLRSNSIDENHLVVIVVVVATAIVHHTDKYGILSVCGSHSLAWEPSKQTHFCLVLHRILLFISLVQFYFVRFRLNHSRLTVSSWTGFFYIHFSEGNAIESATFQSASRSRFFHQIN